MWAPLFPESEGFVCTHKARLFLFPQDTLRWEVLCMFSDLCFFPPSLNKPNIVQDAVVLCGARALLCFPPWPRPEIKRVGIWVGGGVGSETNFISSSFLKTNFGIEISSQICSCVCVFLAVKKIGRNSILSGFQVSPGLTEVFYVRGDGLCQPVNREAFLHQSKVRWC